ncbi:MAG: hypothetical protein ACJA2Q_002808, partial [Pseudohongiellaceae bacterium]
SGLIYSTHTNNAYWVKFVRGARFQQLKSALNKRLQAVYADRDEFNFFE